MGRQEARELTFVLALKENEGVGEAAVRRSVARHAGIPGRRNKMDKRQRGQGEARWLPASEDTVCSAKWTAFSGRLRQ